MQDYSYPSIFLSYLLFFICLAGAIFFFARSWSHGYLGKNSEDPKYRMMNDEEELPHGR